MCWDCIWKRVGFSCELLYGAMYTSARIACWCLFRARRAIIFPSRESTGLRTTGRLLLLQEMCGSDSGGQLSLYVSDRGVGSKESAALDKITRGLAWQIDNTTRIGRVIDIGQSCLTLFSSPLVSTTSSMFAIAPDLPKTHVIRDSQLNTSLQQHRILQQAQAKTSR